jgi:hypothetical protein
MSLNVLLSGDLSIFFIWTEPDMDMILWYRDIYCSTLLIAWPGNTSAIYLTYSTLRKTLRWGWHRDGEETETNATIKHVTLNGWRYA